MAQPALVVLALCTFNWVAAGAESAAPAAPVKRLVVWDGEQATKGAGWANPKGSTVGPQTVEAHSGNTAVEFKFKGSGEEWPGTGWNWCAFQTGPYGTDITAFKNFTFWMKTKGKVTEPQINLLCNGEDFDMPEHHTEKVSVLKYCPQLLDGQWHQVSIPLADLKQPEGFDPSHVGELQIFNAGEGDGSFFIDDIAFEGPSPGGQPKSRCRWLPLRCSSTVTSRTVPTTGWLRSPAPPARPSASAKGRTASLPCASRCSPSETTHGVCSFTRPECASRKARRTS